MPNFLGAVEKASQPATLQDFVLNGIGMAVVVGHLGKDPELRGTADGKQLAKFSVAVSWGKRGSQEHKTEWIYCVAWEREARMMERFSKGDAVLVMGKPTVREYQGKEYAELRVYSVAVPLYKDEESKRPTAPIPAQQQADDQEIPF